MQINESQNNTKTINKHNTSELESARVCLLNKQAEREMFGSHSTSLLASQIRTVRDQRVRLLVLNKTLSNQKLRMN